MCRIGNDCIYAAFFSKCQGLDNFFGGMIGLNELRNINKITCMCKAANKVSTHNKSAKLPLCRFAILIGIVDDALCDLSFQITECRIIESKQSCAGIGIYTFN